MIRAILTGLALLILTPPAYAVTVEDCDWRASAQAIAEPWEEFSRTYANGDVRVTLTDTIEPAAGAFHLVVLTPPFDEVGGRVCQVVSASGTIGFAGVLFEDMVSSYDPATGLTLTVDVQVMATSGDFAARVLAVTINQATGDVTARLVDGK